MSVIPCQQNAELKTKIVEFAEVLKTQSHQLGDHGLNENEFRLQTTSQLQAFLAGTLEVRFCVPDSDHTRYAHIVSVTQRLGYARLNRADKSMVLVARVGGLGHAYARHFDELTPEHLGPSREKLSALVSNGVGQLQGKALKAVRKVNQIFSDRRQLAAHLFYFDQRDHTDRRNHRQHGPHIHYARHLHARAAGRGVAQVCAPFPTFPKSLHVRFDYHHNRTRRSAGKTAPE